MIFMDYLYELPNMSAGMDEGLAGAVTAVPIFLPMFLVFVWGLIFIGGSVAQMRRSNTADLPMWSTLASVVTMMITLSLTLRQGLIQIETLTIVACITIACGIWLFLDRRNTETY